MAQRIKDSSLRVLIDRFTLEVRSVIAEQVEAQVASVLSGLQFKKPPAAALRGKSQAQPDGRRSGRLCPVHGCGKPGAGPRNRWFCRDHARKLSSSEQKGILERNRRLAAEGKLPAQVPAQRIVRLPPKGPRAHRTLDMSCRVEGCPNRSRGPRVSFICDQHRAEMNPEEQRQARERWNSRRKNGASVQPAEPQKAMPVPPIVRKAEAAEG